MGKRTILCVWFGFALFALCALIPPWTLTVHTSDLHSERPADYALLTHSASASLPVAWGYSIDYARLLIEVMVCESFVGSLYFTWARPKDRNGRYEPPPIQRDPRLEAADRVSEGVTRTFNENPDYEVPY
jgi:hypothetical protein